MMSVSELMSLSQQSTLDEAISWMSTLSPSILNKIGATTFAHAIVCPGDLLYVPMAYVTIELVGACLD
jgi:hypothetical protein